MLPPGLLLVAAHEPGSGRVTPRYLDERDEVWVRAVLDLFDAYVGRSVAEREAELPARVRAVAREHGASARVADGVSHVLTRKFALVQGLLQRSEQVRVEVREHARAVVRFAKLSGLLCTYALGERGTPLEVSGPLSILRHTTKYGFALASFFPAVVATPGFRLQARCILGGEPVHVQIDAADRIAKTHRLPRDADSAVERALARDVRRLGSEWTLARESHVLALGSRAAFLDFSLRHAGGLSILVEVVGFYTPEYLRSKLEALRAAAPHPLIVCIDEALACADGELPGTVLRFRRRVDAAKLIEEAERLRLARAEARGE